MAEPPKVAPGVWVKVRGPEPDELEDYRLVDGATADVTQNEIPASSPFAQAIIGKCVGDVVEYSAPSGVMRVEILEIRREP